MDRVVAARDGRKETKHMNRKMTILIGLALGSAITLSAQPGPGRGPGPHRGGPQGFPPPIAVLDTDSDGVLSGAEINQAPAILAAMDQDNDGLVTGTEICQAHGGRQNCPLGVQGQCPNGGNSVLLALFDADQSGALSSQEIQNVPTLLLAYDKDGDGQVSSKEIRPLPGRQAGPNGAMGRGNGFRGGAGASPGAGPGYGRGRGQGRGWAGEVNQ